MTASSVSVYDISFIVFFITMSVCTFYCSLKSPRQESHEESNVIEMSSEYQKEQIERMIVTTKVTGTTTNGVIVTDMKQQQQGISGNLSIDSGDTDSTGSDSESSPSEKSYFRSIFNIAPNNNNTNKNDDDDDVERQRDKVVQERHLSSSEGSHSSKASQFSSSRVADPQSTSNDDNSNNDSNSKSNSKSIDDEKCCSICLGDYQIGEEIGWASNPECTHGFHKECIVNWLMRNRNCPVCRRDFLWSDNSSSNNSAADTSRSNSTENNNNRPLNLSSTTSFFGMLSI